MKKVRKAVIPAAGLGTRFLPATKAMPKEMMPVVDKPVIQYIVEEAVASGIESILIITGRSKRSIEDHFDRSIELEMELERAEKYDMLQMVRSIAHMVDVTYIRQHQPRGLGHAVWCAHEFVGNDPFCILLGDNIFTGDVPATRQLIDVYEKTGASVLGAMHVPASQTSRYGIVDPGAEKDGIIEIRDLVEKPRVNPPSDIALNGRYVIDGDIFPLLKTQTVGTGGEIQLTDALRSLLRSQNMTAKIIEGRLYDTGDRLGFLKATCEFALSRDDLKDDFMKYLKGLVR